MSEEYPYPCCRCGFCCISETCPAGQFFYHIGKHDPCQGLSFDDGLAYCFIAATIDKEMIGVGEGCCIKAQCIKGGMTYNFASLPPVLKQSIARRLA